MIEVDKKKTIRFYQEIKTSKIKQFTLKFRVKKSKDYKSDEPVELTIHIDRGNGGSGTGRSLPRNNNNWNEVEYSIGENYVRDAPRIKVIFEVMPAKSGSLSFDDITFTETVEKTSEIAPVTADKSAAVLADTSPAADDDEYRTFTDKKGRVIEAKIIRMTPNGQEVTVQRRNPKNTITVPLTVFDAETQTYIKCWSLGSDFMNNRIFSVETKRTKELLADKSTNRDGEFSSSTAREKFYGHRFNLIFKNRSSQPFRKVSLEYTLYYNQEFQTKNAHDGCLYKKQSISLSPKSEQEIKTEQVILKSYHSTSEGMFSGGTDLDGELEGVIIHLTLHLDNGETVKKEIIFPDNLKHKWTTKTKDAQTSQSFIP